MNIENNIIDDDYNYEDEDEQLESECEFCSGIKTHLLGCPNNNTSFNQLLTDGYD